MNLTTSGPCSNCAQPSPALIQFQTGGPVCLACVELARDMLSGVPYDHPNDILAARYLWLRNESINQYEHPICVSQERTEQGMRYVGPLMKRELDAAIDRARQAKRSPGF